MRYCQSGDKMEEEKRKKQAAPDRKRQNGYFENLRLFKR